MIFDIHLDESEMTKLNKGGVIILTLPGKIRIIIKKDINESEVDDGRFEEEC